jgi:hypothetical protein
VAHVRGIVDGRTTVVPGDLLAVLGHKVDLARRGQRVVEEVQLSLRRKRQGSDRAAETPSKKELPYLCPGQTVPDFQIRLVRTGMRGGPGGLLYLGGRDRGHRSGCWSWAKLGGSEGRGGVGGGWQPEEDERKEAGLYGRSGVEGPMHAPSLLPK